MVKKSWQFSSGTKEYFGLIKNGCIFEHRKWMPLALFTLCFLSILFCYRFVAFNVSLRKQMVDFLSAQCWSYFLKGCHSQKWSLTLDCLSQQIIFKYINSTINHNGNIKCLISSRWTGTKRNLMYKIIWNVQCCIVLMFVKKDFRAYVLFKLHC